MECEEARLVGDRLGDSLPCFTRDEDLGVCGCVCSVIDARLIYLSRDGVRLGDISESVVKLPYVFFGSICAEPVTRSFEDPGTSGNSGSCDTSTTVLAGSTICTRFLGVECMSFLE